MTQLPDAPWITYYEEYFNNHYGLVESEEEKNDLSDEPAD